MADQVFVCTSSEPFDLFRLPSLIGRPGGEPVQVEVRHPDREADGSCRWCGCREDEVLTVRPE